MSSAQPLRNLQTGSRIDIFVEMKEFSEMSRGENTRFTSPSAGAEHSTLSFRRNQTLQPCYPKGQHQQAPSCGVSAKMNQIRAIQALNKTEIEHGITPEASWHVDYRDTAYINFGGLPYELTEGDIITIFSQFGEPVWIKLARDQETGKSKGFGWLKYEDQRSCDLAVDNLGGAEIAGRLIRVDHARYKFRDDEDPEEGKVGWEDIMRKEGGSGGAADKIDEEEDDQEDEEEQERHRPMLKEERELQLLIQDHDDDDPMKSFLIEEKKKEVEEALRKERRRAEKHQRHKESRHHRSHRSRRDREDDHDDDSGRRHRSRKDHTLDGTTKDDEEEEREKRHRSGKRSGKRSQERDTGRERDRERDRGSRRDKDRASRDFDEERHRDEDKVRRREKEKSRERQSQDSEHRHHRDRRRDRSRSP
ncbi:hypothetical protein DL546_006905 [Coniochaeta pulveracea]|uniref:RRM domain-containing protein n=1 Tax=Coniochaeta pulveracea TaxID=177199 RepID=A0A420Y8Z0_9PEZI|nr:hypothetical protein DL546_006905 [Coniochaeta pulveracea]